MRHFATMRAMLADTISKFPDYKNNGPFFSDVLGSWTNCTRSNNQAMWGVEPATSGDFIGLAALTVPHMMLVDGYVEYQKSQS